MDIVKIINPTIKKPIRMENELSGVMIVIIIGGGVLTFIMLFIFAKRQIMRFALRSRRGPHVPVGHDSKKSIKKEIERRLDCIQKITFEPQLIWDNDIRYIVKPDTTLPPFYYRLKAVDDIKILENEIAKQDGNIRQPRDSLRAYLLTSLAASLNSSGQRLIHQFCDMYEHARHDPSDFGNEEYETYRRLLLKLLDAAKMLKTLVNSRKSSPSRTPVKQKQTKVQSLLDPSRLRPPPISNNSNSNDVIGPNSRINIALGLQQQEEDIIDNENEILTITPYHQGEPSVV